MLRGLLPQAVMSLGETGMVIADGAGVEMRNVGVSAHEYTGSADNTALLIEDCFELYFSGCSFSAPTNGSDRTVASHQVRLDRVSAFALAFAAHALRSCWAEILSHHPWCR